MKFHAAVKDLPERHVARIRHVGPYSEAGEAVQRIFAWGAGKGLVKFPGTDVLAVYYDSPEQVEESKLRLDACISVPEGTTGDGEVKIMTIPGGRSAVAHVELDVNENRKAWDKLFTEWMPQNGVKPDESRLRYEMYLNNPNQHPEKKAIVDICQPAQS